MYVFLFFYIGGITMAGAATTLLGGLGGAAAIYALSNNIFDLAKQRWLALNKPTWNAQGEAKAWAQNGGTRRYVMGQEKINEAMFDTPIDLVKNRVTDLGNSLFDMPGKAYDQYKLSKKFDLIKNDPSVQAMGEAKARALYSQVGKIAPDLVRKAPSAVLPAIQNALLTDSTGLRADYVYNMARAQQSLG